jgi:hypothetical protein
VVVWNRIKLTVISSHLRASIKCIDSPEGIGFVIYKYALGKRDMPTNIILLLVAFLQPDPTNFTGFWRM